MVRQNCTSRYILRHLFTVIVSDPSLLKQDSPVSKIFSLNVGSSTSTNTSVLGMLVARKWISVTDIFNNFLKKSLRVYFLNNFLTYMHRNRSVKHGYSLYVSSTLCTILTKTLQPSVIGTFQHLYYLCIQTTSSIIEAQK